MQVKGYLGILAVLPLLAVGCQSYFFDYTEGVTVKATSMTSAVYNPTPTDVLFVIDNSGTMGEEQAELIKNTEKFITAMVESPNDFHIGIITTDTTHYNGGFANDRDTCCMHVICNTSADCNNKVNLQNPNENALCVAGTCRLPCNSDSDCLPGERCGTLEDEQPNVTGNYCKIVTPCDGTVTYCDNGQLRTPDGALFASTGKAYISRPADNSAAAKQQLITDFQNTIKSLGVQGTTYEAGLQAMLLALKGNKNSDFFRKDADLAVIFVSDEDDCSYENDTDYKVLFGTQKACYMTDNDKLRPVDRIVQELIALKSDISQIRVAGIIGSMPWNKSDSIHKKEPLLGFYASGCYQQGVNGASNDCCCLSGMIDNSMIDSEDFYCKMLAGEPYSQPTCSMAKPRIPDFTQNGLDDGGCSAMPGSRYLDFLERMSRKRTAAGLSSDTLVDSICAAGYQNTLINIVNSVILNDCFKLDKKPLLVFDDDDTDIHPEETLKVTLNGNNLPYSPEGKDKGWRYEPGSNRVCLTGGLHKALNDEFVITIITSSQGTVTGDED